MWISSLCPEKKQPQPLIFKAPIAVMSFTPEGEIVLFTDWDIGPFCLKIGDAYAVFDKPKDLVTQLTDAGCIDFRSLYIFTSCSLERQAAHPVLHPEGALALKKAHQESSASELLKCLANLFSGDDEQTAQECGKKPQIPKPLPPPPKRM